MKTDRDKWEQRYGSAVSALPDPDSLLVEHAALLGSGRAMDLACGRGANALFLAARGFQVDAVDISLKALRVLQSEARRAGADVACVAADLDYWSLPVAQYNLVVVCYFFSEMLISPIKAALKPGGLLVYATYNVRHFSLRPGFNPAYLILPDALSRYFSDFEEIVHETDAGEHANISRLIARRPLGHS